MSSYDAPRSTLAEPALEREAVQPGLARRLLELLRGLSARTLFLALALPMGLFLIAAVPPSQGLDEPNHFFRAYVISGGTIVSPMRDGHAGAVLPACVSEYALGLFEAATRAGRMHPGRFVKDPDGCGGRPASFVVFDNSSLYSPISYLPQTIGVAIARLLGGSVPAMFYAGRLLALLGYAGLVALALTVAPRGRSVLLAVALMPMSLLLGTQFSADGMTIALSLLLVAAVIRCCWHQDATWRSFLLAAVAAAGLAMSKSTYFALAPLLLLVPNRLFGSAWVALAAKAGALAVAALLVAVWYVQVRTIPPGTVKPPFVLDPALQLQWIEWHKQWFARFVLYTLFGPQTGYFTWPGFVSWVGFGRSVTAGSPAPPPLLMAAGIGLLAMAYVREAPRVILLSAGSLVRSALPVGLVAVNAVLIVTALYLTVVPVGGTLLWLQGRYFLPLAAVPVVSLLALRSDHSRSPSLLPLVPLLLVLLGYLVVKVPEYFYQ